MNEEKKNPENIEILLQQYELARPTELRKQQILGAAKDAWLESQSKPAINLMRYVKAIAACVAIIITIEFAGNVALARWWPSVTLQNRDKERTALMEYDEINPSARYYSGTIYTPVPADLKQIKNYRIRMQNLLDESEKVPLSEPVRKNKSQSGIAPAKSFGAYSC